MVLVEEEEVTVCMQRLFRVESPCPCFHLSFLAQQKSLCFGVGWVLETHRRWLLVVGEAANLFDFFQVFKLSLNSLPGLDSQFYQLLR